MSKKKSFKFKKSNVQLQRNKKKQQNNQVMRKNPQKNQSTNSKKMIIFQAFWNPIQNPLTKNLGNILLQKLNLMKIMILILKNQKRNDRNSLNHYKIGNDDFNIIICTIHNLEIINKINSRINDFIIPINIIDFINFI